MEALKSFYLRFKISVRDARRMLPKQQHSVQSKEDVLTTLEVTESKQMSEKGAFSMNVNIELASTLSLMSLSLKLFDRQVLLRVLQFLLTKDRTAVIGNVHMDCFSRRIHYSSRSLVCFIFVYNQPHRQTRKQVHVFPQRFLFSDQETMIQFLAELIRDLSSL